MRDKTAREQVARLEQELREQGDRLNTLRAQLEEQELTAARVREIELEWADAFEKFRNLYARIAKRIEREGAKEDAGEPEQLGEMNPLARRLFPTNREKIG